MNLRHKAHWEQKSENLIKRTIIRSRVADLKRRQESNLEERRNRYLIQEIKRSFYRLKSLLEAEDQMYEQEFMANLETPEQVREKMAQRLDELKQRREQERQEEVNKRLEQRFKDSKLNIC
jgi:uncharacterized protein YbcC (UPF0753/DUF2309 family)